MKTSRALWSLVCVSIVGGLLAVGCERDRAPRQPPKAPVSPRARLEHHLGISLPDRASDIRCRVEGMLVRFVWGRFDVPVSALPDLLSAGLPGRLPPLSNDPELYKKLQAHAGQPPWWKLPPEADVPVSRLSWREADGETVWEHTLSVCVTALDAASSRVHLLYVVDPVSGVPPQDRSGTRPK
jgi:hypothetical protein